jgi:hypothetical protein
VCVDQADETREAHDRFNGSRGKSPSTHGAPRGALAADTALRKHGVADPQLICKVDATHTIAHITCIFFGGSYMRKSENYNY